MVIDLEVQIGVFGHSIREGNFSLYLQSLRLLVKWFFAFDHHNYSGWITVYVFNLISLPIVHPDVGHQMMQGSFSFVESKWTFLRMALDQVHEKNNKVIKGQGGTSGFLNFEDESALIRLETCGPEEGKMLCQLEEKMKDDDGSFHTTSTEHHEDNEHFRLNFREDLQTVFNAIPCKPFHLDSFCTISDIAYTFPKSVVETIKIVLSEGETQVKSSISDRLIIHKTPITKKLKET